MNFLNLWAFWIAAGVVPALLILYFLKLRRKEEPVASTFLWKRAVQDLQVNAPFQKLRKNLLLLLQLLVLTAGVVALARPIISGVETYEGRVVMMIDRSASMNAKEADGRTRLELAKEQAVLRAKSFNRRGSDWLRFVGVEPKTQVMVVAFAGQASVLQPFTTNMNEVAAAIEAIQPTDATTDMTEALQLAQAYMSAPSMITQGMEDTPVTVEQPATLLLFSDGRVNTAKDTTLPGGKMEWVKTGEATDNVGITAFRTRRDYENPEQLQAFVEVRNYGAAEISTDVSIFLDGQLLDAKAITLPAAIAAPAGVAAGPGAPGAGAVGSAAGPDAPGVGESSAAGAETVAPPPASPPALAQESVTSLSFERPVPAAGKLEVRIAREDALPTDNVAYAMIPAPRKLKVLLVTDKNWILQTVLAGLPLEKVDTISTSSYEAAPETQFAREGQSLYDVVIFDKHTTAKMPAGNYLFLGAAPQIPDVSVAEPVADYRLIWWDETHPVLRYVGLDYVNIAKGLKLNLPANADVLMESNVGAALAHLLHDGRHYLVLGFAVEESDFAKKIGFPVWMYNAIRYLGSGGAVDSDELRRPGVTLRMQLPAGRADASLHTPDGRKETVRADNAGVARYAGTDRIGVYELRGGDEILERIAVNLEDPDESNIAPPAEFRIAGGQKVAEGQLIRAATPEIWRWFIGAALLVAMLEWWIYNRRVLV